MRAISLIAMLVLPLMAARAQNFVTKVSSVSFFSDGLLEDISATTEDAKGILSLASGEFIFKVPVASFEFENDLMQEHFNENYMESEKYPYALFKGKLDAGKVFQSLPFNREIMVEGTLEIHGVAQARSMPVTISGDLQKLSLRSVFLVSLADHTIEIPTIVFQKIAETVEVTIVAELQNVVNHSN